MHNLDIKTDLKKTVKKYLTSIKDKNVDEASTNLKTINKKFDKAAKRNIMHKNTASRRKASFSKMLNTLNTNQNSA